MIRVTVKLFAIARDVVGNDELKMELADGSSSSDLFATLLRDHPALQPWRDHLRLAVNCEYVTATVPLHSNDEIAVIPPVSGG